MGLSALCMWNQRIQQIYEGGIITNLTLQMQKWTYNSSRNLFKVKQQGVKPEFEPR